ncbi:MAG: hypothetical protein U0Q03_01760 [Acidimicrobiales bacterium]
MATTPRSTSPGVRARGLVGWRSADSPTRLRVATAVTVLAGVVLSLGGWYAIDRRDTAIGDAAGAAAQLIQVQDVRVQLVQADSLASTAYLVGGQESPESRTEYDEHVSEASAGLLRAVQGATVADRAELEAAAQSFARYVGLVEQARANNRQGFPVGAAYQREARQVASDVVASLRTVEERTRSRVDDSTRRAYRSSWLLVLSALLVLVLLMLGSWWLATRWRRLVNVPIALAGVITVLVLTVGVAINGRAVARAGDAVSGPLSAADLVAQARAAGFDARSSEALTLINRGNGAAYEEQWQLSASVVRQALEQSCDAHGVGCNAADASATYETSHAVVRDLDDQGDWDHAVELATAGTIDGIPSDEQADPPADFAAFARATQADLQAQSSAAQREFDLADDALPLLRLLVVLAGLAVALLAALGYGQRSREYR